MSSGKIYRGFARRSDWLEWWQKPGMKSMLRLQRNYGPGLEDFRPSLKKLIFDSDAEPYAELFHKESSAPVVVNPQPGAMN